MKLLSNNLVLMSYLSGIYLESWFSWLWGEVQKTLKKGRKQTKKTLKNGKKEKRRIRESQITTIKIFGFTFYVKHDILLENIV